VVLNALDNLGTCHRGHVPPIPLIALLVEARRHVNKMCMAANVPLVESGTAGYLGQVQPILKVGILRLHLWQPLIATSGPNGVF